MAVGIIMVFVVISLLKVNGLKEKQKAEKMKPYYDLRFKHSDKSDTTDDLIDNLNTADGDIDRDGDGGINISGKNARIDTVYVTKINGKKVEINSFEKRKSNIFEDPQDKAYHGHLSKESRDDEKEWFN